jgi:hypothetical protein
VSTPEELQRSVQDFCDMLDRMRFTGASQVAEVQQLKILIEKYPVQTRYFLDCQCQAAPTDREAGAATVRHRS